MLDFEVFTSRSSRGGVGPFVTVQRGGVLSVNRDGYELLGEPEAVELLYDRAARVMGFRRAGTNVPHAYRVRSQKASSSVLVSGRSFTRRYGIPTDTARRFPATMFGDVLAVDVNGDGDRAGPQTKDKAAR